MGQSIGEALLKATDEKEIDKMLDKFKLKYNNWNHLFFSYDDDTEICRKSTLLWEAVVSSNYILASKILKRDPSSLNYYSIIVEKGKKYKRDRFTTVESDNVFLITPLIRMWNYVANTNYTVTTNKRDKDKDIEILNIMLLTEDPNPRKPMVKSMTEYESFNYWKTKVEDYPDQLTTMILQLQINKENPVKEGHIYTKSPNKKFYLYFYKTQFIYTLKSKPTPDQNVPAYTKFELEGTSPTREGFFSTCKNCGKNKK